jgi:hypothetical protein
VLGLCAQQAGQEEAEQERGRALDEQRQERLRDRELARLRALEHVVRTGDRHDDKHAEQERSGRDRACSSWRRRGCFVVRVYEQPEHRARAYGEHAVERAVGQEIEDAFA